MAIFIMLSTLGPDGMATLHQRPERLLEVNEEVANMGAKVLHQWVVLGSNDFCTVLEAPDMQTVVKIGVALGARGTLKTQTLPAMPVEELIAFLKSPQQDS
ncbi:MAG: GYD domain-containing protein [Actinobacteria bacterium]|jgi:uncharacterized protein with GYD domain|nr:GYD domain-containing protein [Actinomycetota bacterium]MCL6104997.1 GYD domain-containing protein [Actinomycetota bacterium]